MTRSALAGWIAVISALPVSLSAQDTDLDWIVQEELQAGRIIVNFGDDQRYRGHIRAAVLIDATAEYVWAILEDCENAPEYVPNVLSCELIVRAGECADFSSARQTQVVLAEFRSRVPGRLPAVHQN